MAGLPLARDLFQPPFYAYTEAAFQRLTTVFRTYEAWKSAHPAQQAEEFILAAYEGSVEAVNPDPSPEQLPLLGTTQLPWRWTVEFIAARLAVPVVYETRDPPTRYAPQMLMPTRSLSQGVFWSTALKEYSVQAVITLNYDLLAERTMRHRPMTRPPSPGFHYGGISNSTVRVQTPFGQERRASADPVGQVPLFKLHGSLNWSLEHDRVSVYPDLRPVHRFGGSAAIVPPLPEKSAPRWLAQVWRLAEEALTSVERWVVVGYSMPSYDTAIRKMLQRAASGVALVEIYDPYAHDLVARWASLSPTLRVVARPGLSFG